MRYNYLLWESANEKFCCSHCCEVQKSWTRLLSKAVVARAVSTEGRADLLVALGDWQTDMYNCSVILSQVVGFTIFPHSHVHSPRRVLHRSTPLSVAET